MNRNILLSAAFLLSLAAAAGAQTGGLLQNTLSNHDIVVLAQAGFSENFIADFVAMSRTRFDTSVTGLAEMAKEGLTERLIRVVLNASTAPPAANTAAAPAPPAMVPATVVGPALVETSSRNRAPHRSESAMAITNQAPYYRTSSIFWGFWTTKTGVGSGARIEQPIGVQLGTAYSQVVNPAGVPARYVIIP